MFLPRQRVTKMARERLPVGPSEVSMITSVRPKTN